MSNSRKSVLHLASPFPPLLFCLAFQSEKHSEACMLLNDIVVDPNKVIAYCTQLLAVGFPPSPPPKKKQGWDHCIDRCFLHT